MSNLPSSSPPWEPLVDALLDAEARALHALTPIPRDSETVWRQRWLDAFEHFRNVAVPVSMDLQLYWDHVREGDDAYLYQTHRIYDRAWLVLKKPGHTPRYPEPDPDALTVAFMPLRGNEFYVPKSPRGGLIACGYGWPDGSIAWVLAEDPSSPVPSNEPCTDAVLLTRLEQMIRGNLWAIPDDSYLPLSYVRYLALAGGIFIVLFILLPLILFHISS